MENKNEAYNQTDDLVSLVLWTARRLHKTHKKFAYGELKKIIGDDHKYSSFLDETMKEEL